MKRSGWHSLPLLLFAFFCFLAASTAQHAHPRGVDHQEPLQQQQEAAAWEETNGHHEGSSQEENRVEMSASVVDAIDILREIQPPTLSKLARYTSRPKGFLGTTGYYAKEIFTLLFMNSPQPANTLSSSSASASKLPQPLFKAVKLLQETAQQDDPDALFLLAELSFYGNYSHPVDYNASFAHYKQLAELDGNSTAQHMVGFFYATGLAVPADQAKSMIYHTFAAEQHDTRSEMTLAYRHHAGIATPRNCDEAVHWYERVAHKAIDYYRSGPPGGRNLGRDAYRIADEDGGAYGEGASVSSSGAYAKQGGPTSDAYADIEDVLEYLHMQSSKGDLKATFGLARLHYDGSQGLKRDLKLAKKHFLTIARQYWTESGKVLKEVPSSTERLATKSAGYLGRMFLRGEGMEQSFSKARIWFTRGLSNGDALSQYSLGLMHLEGLGVEQDVAKAADYLAAAADQELAVAQTSLGRLFLDQGDERIASQYFELAVRNGHIEAFYYLAEMNNQGIGRDRQCGMAAAYYKIVIEKAEAIWGSLGEAGEAYADGDIHSATIAYLMAAEQGSENAQANVAWLLDHTQPTWSPFTRLTALPQTAASALTDAFLSLVHWTRSAKQNNIDSLVKMGDYHLLGLGTSLSPENAAACYQTAAETLQSAQALWNLGWMHENGVGIAQDFHLAKRFYDQALETNREAYLPVQLSLWKLRWRSWWNGLTHGGVHGIEDDEGARAKRRSFAEWVNDFLAADAAYYEHEFEADDWDSRAENDPMPGGDEYWGDGEAFDEDGVVETMLIGGLVAVLAALLFYRQQRQRAAEQRRLHEQQQQGQQEQEQPPPVPVDGQQAGGGMFPQPGDPNWNNWVAGGVGH